MSLSPGIREQGDKLQAGYEGYRAECRRRRLRPLAPGQWLASLHLLSGDDVYAMSQPKRRWRKRNGGRAERWGRRLGGMAADARERRERRRGQ